MSEVRGGVRAWLESRLGLRALLGPLLSHPVPRGTGYWYVFGSASMTLLLVQVVTGVLLATVYVPAADKAYESLEYLNYTQYLGWLLRAIHFWAASGMVVMVAVHAIQVFLFGAFKYPREMTWIVGVFLLVCTLAMGFTGQVLRWDQDAFWGVGLAASMAGRVPVLGPAIVRLLLGGPNIGGETLSRFFALHVYVIPATLFGLLGLHLYLVLKHGISTPPGASDIVDPATYHEKYERVLAAGEPFAPGPIAKDAIFSCLTVLGVLALAVAFGPFGPNGPPDPTLIDTEPRPEWYFLPLFALLALCPPQLETLVMLVFPPILIGGLLAVPFICGRGERSALRRPVGVIGVLFVVMIVLVLTWLGHEAAWSPRMDAWSGAPVPARLVRGRSPLALQGAVVLQNKNCRNCHALEGLGGKRGPDLTDVATKLNHDELVRQVIQGGGNMPAYGKMLKPEEVTALVAYLETLLPPGQAPAGSSASLPNTPAAKAPSAPSAKKG